MVGDSERPTRASAADRGVRSTVAAVIPHWNRAELLSTLLESLSKQVYPCDEVIVVDNGSTDHSAEVAEKFGARFIPLGQNCGFARAVNLGIQESFADWIAILN